MKVYFVTYGCHESREGENEDQATQAARDEEGAVTSVWQACNSSLLSLLSLSLSILLFCMLLFNSCLRWGRENTRSTQSNMYCITKVLCLLPLTRLFFSQAASSTSSIDAKAATRSLWRDTRDTARKSSPNAFFVFSLLSSSSSSPSKDNTRHIENRRAIVAMWRAKREETSLPLSSSLSHSLSPSLVSLSNASQLANLLAFLCLGLWDALFLSSLLALSCASFSWHLMQCTAISLARVMHLSCCPWQAKKLFMCLIWTMLCVCFSLSVCVPLCHCWINRMKRERDGHSHGNTGALALIKGNTLNTYTHSHSHSLSLKYTQSRQEEGEAAYTGVKDELKVPANNLSINCPKLSTQVTQSTILTNVSH